MTEKFSTLVVGVEQLLLDPNNYRFQGDKGRPEVPPKRFAEPKVQSAIQQRLEDDGISELKQSILSNGFLPVEKIVVKKWEGAADPPNRYVVLEGNRRVATLKRLVADDETGAATPEGLIASFKNLSLIELTTDDPSDYLSIMGVRHVGGIKEWGGYQSAKLVYELKDDFALSTQQVAARLGLSAQEVNRRYRSFRAIEEMRADEEFGEFVTSDLYPMFHEALAIPRIREWLCWDDATFSFAKDTHRLFYGLIAPHKDETGATRPPKMSSYSEVRELRAVLDNEDAYQSLLELTKPFSDATALVKAADAGKDWPAKVRSALNALNHMGILESTSLSASQIKLVAELHKLSEKLLDGNQAQTT